MTFLVWIAIAAVLAIARNAAAQGPPDQPTPPSVRLVFDEQQLKDPLRARMYDVIAQSVEQSNWPTIQLTQATSIASLLNKYFDVYNVGPGKTPETQRLLASMIVDANPALVQPQSRGMLSPGPVKLPPVPVRAFSSYRTGRVEARIFNPAEMSYVLRAPSGELVGRSENTVPTADNDEVRRGALTEVVLSLTSNVGERLRRYRSYLRPILAVDERQGAMATVTLLEAGNAAPCDSASRWLARSPYPSSLKTVFTQAEINRIQNAAANLPLTVIDWNVNNDARGHGSKVRAVVSEFLQRFGLSSIDTRVQTFEMNPKRNRDGLKKILAAYKAYVTAQSGGRDLAKLFESAEKWVTDYVPPDEYALDQHVPSLVLQAVFWSHFSRPQALNFSFTTDSAALTVLDAHFMPAAKAFAALAAGNAGMPASPVLLPQAEAFRWENVVNVTHGRPDGTIDGDTTNEGYKVIVNVIAPGCGYTTPPLAQDENGSSFASPYVATAAWIRMLQGLPAPSLKRALTASSEPISTIGEKVESGGLFDPALFLLHPGPHVVSAEGAYLSLSSLTFKMTYMYKGTEISITNPAPTEPSYVVAFHACENSPDVCAIVRRSTSTSGLFFTFGPIKTVTLDALSGQQRFQTNDAAALLKLIRLITF